MKTPVYIKMDAPESLLLSEGVCRQLDIITYHREVQEGKNKHEQLPKCCTVPTVRVQLKQDVRVLPNECITTQVRLESKAAMMKQQPFLVETDADVMKQTKIQVFDTVLQASEDDTTQLSLLNQIGACQKIMKGADIGKATPMDVLDERSTQAEDITSQW